MAEAAVRGCGLIAPLEWLAAAIARLPQRLLRNPLVVGEQQRGKVPARSTM